MVDRCDKRKGNSGFFLIIVNKKGEIAYRRKNEGRIRLAEKKNRKAIYIYIAGHSNAWASIPLIDIMLKDMGISNRRKKNYYEHWFGHVLPEDYLSVVTHRV